MIFLIPELDAWRMGRVVIQTKAYEVFVEFVGCAKRHHSSGPVNTHQSPAAVIDTDLKRILSQMFAKGSFVY